MFLNHNKPWKLRKDLVSYLRRRKLLDPCRKIFWPVPICTPRAEPENHEHAPCWTNETRASQTINTVRVDQHAPCKTGNQCTRLANTPRAADPCRTNSLSHGPCSWPVCGRSNAHASLARSVCWTRAASLHLLLEALLTHGLWFSPRTQMHFTKTQSIPHYLNSSFNSFFKAHKNPNLKSQLKISFS